MHVYHDDDGSLVIKARVPAEAGELLLKALDVAVESQYRGNVSAETSLPPTHWTRLPALNCEHDLEIDSRTAATGCRGESMDYGLAVQGLLQRSQRAHQG